jgi:predicted transcriptional regulator YdeE
MADRPNPVFRTIEELSLIGTMATYDSQAEASQGIPQQWRAFRLAHPALESSSAGDHPKASSRTLGQQKSEPLCLRMKTLAWSM